MYRVSFTGYRPAKLPFFGEDDPMCINLKNRIAQVISELAESGAREFNTGMALGVDIWCAEAVAAIREKYPDIILTAVIPCDGQQDKWNAAEKQRYSDVVGLCDRKIHTGHQYTNDCMHRRNRALVEMCDILVAVYNGKKGGTKYTVDYAYKVGRKVIILPPL